MLASFLRLTLTIRGMKRSSLLGLATRYFGRTGCKVKRDKSAKFDLIVRKRREVHPVWVKDWNRTVGVNIVIYLDKASQQAGFTAPVLVADHFSEHARAYASRRGVWLVTRSEMRQRLR